MSEGVAQSGPRVIATAAIVFLVGVAGTATAFALWSGDISGPSVAILGSGDRLSVLVTDGAARLIIASGDDPIAFENALARLRPLYARRVDVLLIAGQDRELLVPLSAREDPHVRTTLLMAPLPPSPETDALDATPLLEAPRNIQLGPETTVVVETAAQIGADPNETFPAWRATIEHRGSRVVVVSDGKAAALFPPSAPAALLAIAGSDPAAAWDLDPAVGIVANAGAIDGPEMRSAFTESRRPPRWGFRVAPGEALRIRFVEGGVEIPSGTAQDLGGRKTDAIGDLTSIMRSRRVRRREPPWPAETPL
jgi:hypothetical protein